MKLIDQFRIELTGAEAEQIVKDHIEKMLKERGYTLDYSGKEDGGSFPDTFWRGVKPTE